MGPCPIAVADHQSVTQKLCFIWAKSPKIATIELCRRKTAKMVWIIQSKSCWGDSAPSPQLLWDICKCFIGLSSRLTFSVRQVDRFFPSDLFLLRLSVCVRKILHSAHSEQWTNWEITGIHVEKSVTSCYQNYSVAVEETYKLCTDNPWLITVGLVTVQKMTYDRFS